MQFRLLRLRFRRRLRKGQRQVEDFSSQTEENINQHFFQRFERLRPVRRFVSGWLLLMGLLIAILIGQNIFLSNYFQTVKAVPGGIYNEGILGTFSTANPLFANTDADNAVASLLFAGLLKYDDNNQLVGDLASGYTVDEHSTTYTVKLKPNLTWQDGQPLTSADVIYTYQMIQNPDAQSPLQNGWSGVTITAPDKQTIVFKLPNQLASFPYNLTNGIVPKHILGKLAPSDLRSSDFNTVRPVGAGPFKWQTIQVTGKDPSNAEVQIALVPFDKYQAGTPKLQEFNVRVFASKDKLVDSFKSNQLTAIEGLTSAPKEIQENSAYQKHNLLLTAQTMVFFKTSTGVLAEQKVRQALVRGANTPGILTNLEYPTHQVREPFLTSQFAYDPGYVQAGYDQKSAKALLDQAGWVVGKDGIRTKGTQRLSFGLTGTNTPEYRMVTSRLKDDWRAIGADVKVQLQDAADFHSTLAFHSYDSVLYGISIGVDPDVFVYWDSSQADIRSANRLNLSEYKSTAADASLEAGRTRLNPAVRKVKYKPFLQAWQQDDPALGLYQPRLLYITNGRVAGLSDHSVNTAANRFNNVVNWQIRQAKVTNQ